MKQGTDAWQGNADQRIGTHMETKGKTLKGFIRRWQLRYFDEEPPARAKDKIPGGVYLLALFAIKQ